MWRKVEGEVFVCSCMYTLTLTRVAVGNARLARTESRTACSHPRHRCTGTLAVLSSRVGMNVWSAKTGSVATYILILVIEIIPVIMCFGV